MSGTDVGEDTDRRPSGERRRMGPLRIVVAVVVLVAVFGFALPQVADYGEAWQAVAAMSGLEVGVLLLAVLWNLVTYWPLLIFTLPGLRVREAAVVNQASTAVANTVPGGGAIAVGVTYRMLRTWGFSTPAIANNVMATGLANSLAKLVLPVVALAAVAVTGEVQGSYLRLVGVGLAVLTAVLVVGGVALRAEGSTARLGAALDRLVGRVRRDGGDRIERWLLQTREQIVATVRRTGWRILVATVISHLSLWLVLLVALRAVGVAEHEVSWARVLAAFAFVRLLSAVPVTPGGVGVVELGYVGALAVGGGDGFTSQVTAAVLVFRAVTYALPILLGALAWIVYQAAGSWHRPPDTRGAWR